MARSTQVARNRWRMALRAEGYRATPVRLAVLQAFEQAARPLSVSDVQREIPRDIDQATVYRTVHTLLAAGLLMSVALQQRRAYFELATLPHHHHVICTKCDTIEEVSTCLPTKVTRAALRQTDFAQIADHSLEFFGLCIRCAR